MINILADQDIPFVASYFPQDVDLILRPGRAITAADVKSAEILLVRSVTTVNADLLTGSAVRFVGTVTAGTDHIDLDFLNKQGIQWCAAPGFNAPPVADYVVSVIAALQQRELLSKNGLKAAVIGVGEVGRRVVSHLKALNITVLQCDPLRTAAEKDFEHTPLEDIADVDIVSVHVPLVRDGEYPTLHFLDEAFFKRQKKGTVLINASRGNVIQPQDLMTYARHMLWCFDVWPNEPHIDLDMLEMAQIATPHIAGYSRQSQIRGIAQVYRRICETGMIKADLCDGKTQLCTLMTECHDWQSCVLTVFDIWRCTTDMKKQLRSDMQCAVIFDAMRREFLEGNGKGRMGYCRSEFAFLRLLSDHLSSDDRNLLTRLGFSMRLSNDI
ncbi:MAG TPA: 4-phosphoerythronate dehydrogenase [Gammaproteobacteria bacterium]|jgi:erythronate-4-phosphate dehydrogenase|nr:4-phosphoerythronate dehydrogenase [Gammaproteobacteria bacterium]